MNSKNDLSLRDIDEILKESDEVLRESQAKISKFRKLMNKIEYFEGTNNAKVKHQCYHKKIEHIEPSIAVVNKDDDKNDKESYTIRWVNEHFYDSERFQTGESDYLCNKSECSKNSRLKQPSYLDDEVMFYEYQMELDQRKRLIQQLYTIHQMRSYFIPPIMPMQCYNPYYCYSPLGFWPMWNLFNI